MMWMRFSARTGLLIAHLDASPWNAVWADGALAGFVDWDTASPSRREDDLAFSALTWVPLLTAEVAEQAVDSVTQPTGADGSICSWTGTDTLATQPRSATRSSDVSSATSR